MEKLDLTTLSEEQREKVMAIVNEKQIAETTQTTQPRRSTMLDVLKEQNTSEPNKIREEYLAGVKNIKQSSDLESIELDTKLGFEDELRLVGRGVNPGYDMHERRLKGKLSNDDVVTYKQLEVIHKNGVSNFWNKVKNVVESREVVDMSDVDDKVNLEEYL